MSQGSSQTRLRERYERGIYRRRTRDGATRWEVSHVDRDGRQRWETLPTLTAARKRRAELTAKPQHERLAVTRQTFAQAAEQWLALRQTSGRRPLRPSTASYYAAALDRVLLPRFGRWQLAEVDADAISKLTRDLEREGLHTIDPRRPKRPLGASAIRNYLKPLQGVLALAVRRRWIAANPFDVLTDDDRPRQAERTPAHEWTTEEITALLDAAQTLAARGVSKYDYTPLLRLTVVLGLRLGEVLGLQWQDFDEVAAQLHVRRQWLRSGEYGPPKTARGVRTIDLPMQTVSLLVALRGNVRTFPGVEDGRPIFASHAGTPLGHRNVTRRGFESARDLAGLPAHLTFHDLRHAAASRLIVAGLPDTEIAYILGHDVETLRRVYSHLYDRAARAEARRAALAMEGGTA